jgi:hypothetical protein
MKTFVLRVSSEEKTSIFSCCARNCLTWRWPQGRSWCFAPRERTPLVFKGVWPAAHPHWEGGRETKKGWEED